MATLDLPGFEVEWCESGKYLLPDSGGAVWFNLNIIDKPRAFLWFIKAQWYDLTALGRFVILCTLVKIWFEHLWPTSISRSA